MRGPASFCSRKSPLTRARLRDEAPKRLRRTSPIVRFSPSQCSSWKFKLGTFRTGLQAFRCCCVLNGLPKTSTRPGHAIQACAARPCFGAPGLSGGLPGFSLTSLTTARSEFNLPRPARCARMRVPGQIMSHLVCGQTVERRAAGVGVVRSKIVRTLKLCIRSTL